MPSPTRRGAHLIALTFVGLLCVEAAVDALNAWFLHQQLNSFECGLALDVVITTFRRGVLLGAALQISLLSALGWLISRLGDRPALRVALGLLGLRLAVLIGHLGLASAQARLGPDIWRAIGLGQLGLFIVAMGALCWGARPWPASRPQPLAVAALALGLWAVGIVSLQFVTFPEPLADVLPFVLPTLKVLAHGALAWVFIDLARRSDAAPAPTPRAPTGPESEATSTLRSFTAVLTLRVLLVVLGVALGVAARLAGSAPLAKMVAYIVPVVSIVLGLMMLAALIRLASLLDAGAVAARLAAVLVGVGLALDAYGIKLVGALVGRGDPSGLDQLPWVQRAGYALGLGAMLAVVTMLHRVALMNDASQLGAEADRLRIIVGATMITALAARGAAAVRSPSLPMVLMLAGLTLVLAVYTLARFVSVSRRTGHLLSPEDCVDG